MIFADGFESGDFSHWSSAVTDGGRLSVSPQAAMVGAQGMRAFITSTKPIYVVDTSPAAETSYHARFYFSPNSFTIPKNKIQDLFIGRTSSGLVIFRLQFQSISGNYQVRGTILNGSGRIVTTNWYTISNSAHAIELAWKSATSTNSNSGSLSLWLDGTIKETRTGIANGGHRLEEVRLGAQTIPVGATGMEYYDAFFSTRTSYIGP